jgi:tetrapyrrole methylase family protein/MazG family protein
MTPHTPSETLSELEKLIRLIETLRGKNGCPWDRKQTPRSIMVYLIEEIYELSEAVECEATRLICEELGDVLFQVFFIARLFEETGDFNIGTVARQNTDKMIRRHPHVFGGDRLDDTDRIRQRWTEIKRQEKKQHSQESILDSIPAKLPALMRAYRVSERAAGAGLEESDAHRLRQKAQKNWERFISALNSSDRDSVASTYGELLFALVGMGRLMRIHPETALSASIHRFVRRFKKMEAAAFEQGLSIESATHDTLRRLWQSAREEET